MVDIDVLSKLLPVLRSNGIASFKSQDYALTFHVEHSPPQLIEDPAETTLPPDLRTDKINSFDSILEWSAPPSADMEELPLTGDAPL